MIRVLFSLAVVQLVALGAAAHPVAQGTMEITVRRDCIEVHARVSSEEAFIAQALGRTTDEKTLGDVWRRHADYLLAHFHLSADGTPAAGAISGMTPPDPAASSELWSYYFRFQLPAEHQPPRSIILREDVLNEFNFAPGNRWEASYVVRIEQENGPVREGLLLSSRTPLTFVCDWDGRAGPLAPALDKGAMSRAFILHGLRHILGGYDHLLFVAALVFAVRSMWDLVKVVTAFTIAHTFTLTLAVLDLVRLSNRVVEPIIAASILFVALQNLVAPSRSRGWTRLGVAFGFGLFHGLGFAGGLLSAMEGMEGVAIATAIAAFSLGVELGHQLVALPLFAALKFTRSYGSQASDPERIPRWVLRMGSSAICAAGAVYLVAALR